jgi:hypothetical protein
MATHPTPDRDRLEEYADGEIHVRPGHVNTWLLVVYVALAVWGIYYLVRFWTEP